MLLLKLSNACFIDSPENVDINHETSEFVLQYIFNCCSQAELDQLGLATKRSVKDKDLDKLPKTVQREIRAALARRIEI